MVSAVPLVSRSAYVHALRPDLPARVFERAPSRVVVVPIYIAVIAVAMAAVARGWIPWFLVPLASLVIAGGFAGLTFFGHEVLHGAIVRNKRLQYVLGAIGFLPFVISPRLWIGWHNRAHHSKANFDDDPDVYPTIEGYRASRGARFAVNTFSLGGRRWRGALSLVLGFTVQSTHQLAIASSCGVLTAREQRRALAETAAGVAFWAGVAALVGFVPFLFVFVVPLLLANACVMAFILTNHSLSPRVDVNDPLVSGLTVTTSRLVTWLTLGFGFHVEHHLFPAMSSRHAPAVRERLLVRWPERYQSMPLTEALGRLHRSARVYHEAATLCDPRTGALHATLLPRAPAALR